MGSRGRSYETAFLLVALTDAASRGLVVGRPIP